MRFLIAILIASSGCGSSDECASDEVEVAYLGGPRDNEIACKPLPASCNGVGDCSVTACIRDMYGLCDAPYNGVACSDTFAPPIISCNP
ncbi:hypothetical protein BH11MYX3_BH11MYX3_47960 [soil metagenome]